MSATAIAATRMGANGRTGVVSTVGGGRLVRFQIGGQPFALPLERVAEVVALGSATATAPRGWLGTLARNGFPVPIGDLAYLLGGTGHGATRREMRAVILRGRAAGADVGTPLFGVTVESVPTVVEIGDERPEPLPALVQRHAAALVKATLIRDDEMLLILDPDAIIGRLVVGIVRADDGRISELRGLPRRVSGDTGRIAPAAGRSIAPDPPRRDTPVVLLGSIETADGGAGIAPAMPMGWVQEVRSMQPLRPIPHAPASLSGVIAWRGRCLPVIDLTQRLTGIPSAESNSRRLLIVGPQRGEALGGMIVPGVRGLRTIEAAPTGSVPPLPDTLDPGLLLAWTRHGDESVAILDPATCFA